jgi:nitronate monooxygenase
MLTTRFTRLVGCSVPVQLAGMVNVSHPALVAAVTEAGGLGMLGGGRLSQSAVMGMVEDTRRLTPGPFGVNFLVPFVDRATVQTAARAVNLVEFFYGAPDAELVELVHAGGALACWQVGSVAEAVAAEAAGCDFIVAQGIEAGGHVRGTLGLWPLLSGVLAAVHIPVLASGGIATGRAMAAALAAGCDGVRVGTRFVASTESYAHPAYIEALVAATAEDTVLTQAFSVGWKDAQHRVLRSCIDLAEGLNSDVVGTRLVDGSTSPVARFAVGTPSRTTTGEVLAMALYAGQSVGDVHRVQPAGKIMHELAGGAEALLRVWGASEPRHDKA